MWSSTGKVAAVRAVRLEGMVQHHHRVGAGRHVERALERVDHLLLGARPALRRRLRVALQPPLRVEGDEPEATGDLQHDGARAAAARHHRHDAAPLRRDERLLSADRRPAGGAPVLPVVVARDEVGRHAVVESRRHLPAQALLVDRPVAVGRVGQAVVVEVVAQEHDRRVHRRRGLAPQGGQHVIVFLRFARVADEEERGLHLGGRRRRHELGRGRGGAAGQERGGGEQARQMSSRR